MSSERGQLQVPDPEFRKALEALGEHVPDFVDERGLFDHSDRIFLKSQMDAEKHRLDMIHHNEQEQLAAFRIQSSKPPSTPSIAIPAKETKLVADRPLQQIVIRKRVQPAVKKQPAKRVKTEHNNTEDMGSSDGLPLVVAYASDSDSESKP